MNFFRIARWEYTTRFRSRSFLFSTFILPILFSLMITLPAFFINYQEDVSTKLIGFINLAEKNYARALQKNLNRHYRLSNGSPEYVVMPVSVKNSPLYKEALLRMQQATTRKDSVTEAYNKVRDLRASYYNKRNLPNKNYLLQKTYDQMVEVRELKDVIEIEFENQKAFLDSVFNREARRSADSLLFNQVLNAYLVFPENVPDNGDIEYHTYTPGNLLETERLQKVINRMIVKIRLGESKIQNSKIDQILKPVEFRKFHLRSRGEREWNFYVDFYGSIIGVLLLFMAIFTSGGFLFSSVLNEKTNRVIEILLSYASSRQIMAGKIFGLGFLGLTQVLIWLGITSLFVVLNLFDAGEVTYLNWQNGLYFLLYFSLGYLLYASIFVSIGAIFSSEQEAQQINVILRTFAIVPVILVFLLLKQPNSEIIQWLSYFPLLTPYFMIMRISQSGGMSLLHEIYITSGILIVSIIGMVFIAAKIFRMGILMYGKKLNWKEIKILLRSS